MAEGDKKVTELDFGEKKKRTDGILVVKGNEEKANNLVRQGGIDVNFFIESHGLDKEKVSEALQNTVLKDLKNEERLIVREINFHPVIDKEGMYSGFVEANFVAKDLRGLIYLCTRYGPAAIEVLKPDSLTIERGELQNLLADVSANTTVLTNKIMELMTPEAKTKALSEGLGI
jgi:hypothetical protein